MKKLSLLLLTGLLGLSVLSGCQNDVSDSTSTSENRTEASSNNSVDVPSTAESTTEAAINSIGPFTTTDIYGNTYTEDIFADYDLTLINVFATWCSPCVKEIPYLERVYKEYAEQKVNVIGFILDGSDSRGNPIESTVKTAKKLAENTGATYPFLVPDATDLNGFLTDVTSVPTTIFVDKNGNIVGETYIGSRHITQWQVIVDGLLRDLESEE